jgi:hypothetical protein
MRRVENEWVLRALPDEVIDREETPIVNLFVDVLPVRKQIVLLRQNRFERRKAGSISGLAVYPFEILRDEIADLRVLRDELAEPLP